MTEDEFNTWKSRVLDTKWQEAQAFVQKEKMEKQKTKLSFKIREALKSGPSTNDLLAKKLGHNLKAVESHTFRMERAGELKKLRRGVYADPAYVEPTAPTTNAAMTSPTPTGLKEVVHRSEPAKPVNELNTPVLVEKEEQSAGPDKAFDALCQEAFQQWKWGREKFTEMYYKIGEDAIKHWIVVYRANTKYICRMPPAEFEELVATLGIEQVESVIQKRKHDQKRIAAMARESDDIDDDDDEWNGYSSMEAEPLPSAEAKQYATAEPNYTGTYRLRRPA